MEHKSRINLDVAAIFAFCAIFSIAGMHPEKLICAEILDPIEDREKVALLALNHLGLESEKLHALGTLPTDIMPIENKTLLLYCTAQRHYAICHVPGCKTTFEQIALDNIMYALRRHLKTVHRFNCSRALKDVPHIKR